ncbi:kinase-like domain-containing protein [Nemania sp. FL0031]|nr:kinase-like domain-containing protein [Nemania sp. FL0031]
MSNPDNSPPNIKGFITSPKRDVIANPVCRSYESNDVSYEITATTFKKTSRLPFNDPYPDGTPFTWFRSLNHERITNEAKALVLVHNKTTIPVPRLLEHGQLPDGRRYLVTEFIDGLTLKGMHSQGCLKGAGQKHTEDTPCKKCLDQAHSNALDFIANIVLPQLAKLKSQQRGIDGFVMPPSWLAPDAQPPWKGKRSWQTIPLEKRTQNIILDRQDLQVKALIDWEHAGYFPPGMERWPGTLDMLAYRKRADNLPEAITKFLLDDYLECYAGWGDKDELQTLINAGELPDPSRLI